jgi:hypothetical protein
MDRHGMKDASRLTEYEMAGADLLSYNYTLPPAPNVMEGGKMNYFAFSAFV